MYRHNLSSSKKISLNRKVIQEGMVQKLRSIVRGINNNDPIDLYVT